MAMSRKRKVEQSREIFARGELPLPPHIRLQAKKGAIKSAPNQDLAKSIFKPEKLENQLILLTDNVYGNNPPEEMKDHYFKYVVSSYDSSKKKFHLVYCNKMIDKEGSGWIHQNGFHEPLMNVALSTVLEARQRYMDFLLHTRKNEKKCIAVAEETIKQVQLDSTEIIDCSDLDRAADNDIAKGWKGLSVMLVDFDLTGDKK